jgi:hypothetical protein
VGAPQTIIRKEIKEGMNIYEILIGTSLLCGMGAAFLAKLKGRPPFTWFIIGALLNVVALFIIFFATKPKTLTQKSGVREG